MDEKKARNKSQDEVRAERYGGAKVATAETERGRQNNSAPTAPTPPYPKLPARVLSRMATVTNGLEPSQNTVSLDAAGRPAPFT